MQIVPCFIYKTREHVVAEVSFLLTPSPTICKIVTYYVTVHSRSITAYNRKSPSQRQVCAMLSVLLVHRPPFRGGEL